MQVQHKMYILFRLLDEFLVLVIRSPRSLLAIEHSPGHVGPLNKPDQRLHHLRHWRSELRLRLHQQRLVHMVSCSTHVLTVLYLGTQVHTWTQSATTSAKRERFGRVKALECWIDHPVQGVDVMQLGSCPPDK